MNRLIRSGVYKAQSFEDFLCPFNFWLSSPLESENTLHLLERWRWRTWGVVWHIFISNIHKWHARIPPMLHCQGTWLCPSSTETGKYSPFLYLSTKGSHVKHNDLSYLSLTFLREKNLSLTIFLYWVPYLVKQNCAFFSVTTFIQIG